MQSGWDRYSNKNSASPPPPRGPSLRPDDVKKHTGVQDARLRFRPAYAKLNALVNIVNWLIW